MPSEVSKVFLKNSDTHIMSCRVVKVCSNVLRPVSVPLHQIGARRYHLKNRQMTVWAQTMPHTGTLGLRILAKVAIQYISRYMPRDYDVNRDTMLIVNLV